MDQTQMTFHEWLYQFREQDTAIGDLARSASIDESFSYLDGANVDKIRNYLRNNMAGYNFLDTLNDAWQAYTEGKSVESMSNGRTYAPSWDDERMTISRPILPNYIGHQIPTLIRCCADTFDLEQIKNEIIAPRIQSSRRTPSGLEFLFREKNLVESITFQEAVQQYGSYFRREFGYDFLPYTVEGHLKKGDLTIHPYLFFEGSAYDSAIRPIGACTFYKYEKWELGWVWFHPYERNKGHLSKAWPYFEWKYGEFTVQSPWSRAMKFFLEKHGHWQSKALSEEK
jgi:uncharacterized protein YozE (UPF0346 family)